MGMTESGLPEIAVYDYQAQNGHDRVDADTDTDTGRDAVDVLEMRWNM